MRVEPPADMRSAATSLFQMLTAYVDSGFTREEAFKLCLEMALEAGRHGPDKS